MKECGGLGVTSKALRNFTCISVLRTNQLLFLIVADLKVLGFCWFYIYVAHGFEANDVLICLLACLRFVRCRYIYRLNPLVLVPKWYMDPISSSA
jgi:hypothetical protein